MDKQLEKERDARINKWMELITEKDRQIEQLESEFITLIRAYVPVGKYTPLMSQIIKNSHGYREDET